MPKTVKDAETVLKTSKDPGAALEWFLEEYQINATQLAEALKLSSSGVRQIKTNQTKISTQTAMRLAKAFGTTPEDWLGAQIRREMAEAKSDEAFSQTLKEIPKLKKPAPGKAAAGKAAAAVDDAPKAPRGRRKKSAE